MQTQSPSFKAKFLYSDSLKQVADYAAERGKFGKLNEARKNIDKAALRTRLLLDAGINEKGDAFVSFTKFAPKKDVVIPKSMDDYIKSEPIVFTTGKTKNWIKFAYEKILKLGNSAPENNMYKRIVLNKN